jgi:hypothetical protein
MGRFGFIKDVYSHVVRVPILGPAVRMPVRLVRALKRSADPGAFDKIREIQELQGVALNALSESVRETTEWAPDMRELADLQGVAINALRDSLAEIDKRLEVLEAPNTTLSDGLADIVKRLEAVETFSRADSEIAPRPSIGEVVTAVESVSSRLEFVRAELMFELRAASARGPKLGYEPRTIAADKVDMLKANGNVKLNIGCGHVPLEGYINVDQRDLPGVDIVAEATDLPFELGSVDQIFSSHVLEHFPIEHLRRVVLPHWIGILRPGGTFRCVVPDAEAMIEAFARGEMSFDDLREVTYGLQEYDGDFHFNMFSRVSLPALLTSCGLISLSYSFQGRRNGKCFDMEIAGIRQAV